ncbi:hypothetical protein SAMN05216266_13510 [Amycolatopsis marina]|uniref:Uncharacterized protein n=1 Tax=Amycolatopsis marina TaxID=490629 RepID=A0A1I1CRA6_9PSEU|nr:hypothetical protein SAMN05216266_13510 [Amycolatopsis marina]
MSLSRRALTGALAAVFVVCQVNAGAIAQAEPDEQPPAPVTSAASQPAVGETVPTNLVSTQDADVEPQLTTPISPVPPVEQGEDGSVGVERGPSKALQSIPPLPALDPGAGTVPVERSPVTPDPPVRPEKLTLPERPGQELVDATTADATETLRRAGRLTPDGAPDLAASNLQPQVSSAQVVDPSRRATLQELIDALTSGELPPPLPVDPLALLEELPDGIPRITYRVCSESETKQVSCSLTLPLGVPAVVDVTGDRTPDVLADLLPAVAVGDIVGPVREILDLERELDEVTSRLGVVLELLEDPLNAILHPELLVERLRLQDLVASLTTTLQEKVEALLRVINVGLAMLSLRLPTSELAGEDLPGHVWAVYDIPGRKRLSLGYDGFRRGSSLPTASLGVFTLNPFEAVRGIFDIKASLIQVGAGESLAVTAGMASVTEDDAGRAYDPTVASSRFSPVPKLFHAHAFVDPGAADRSQQATVDASSSKQTQLDAQVLSNRHSTGPGTDRFDQLKVDMLPTEVSASLTRPAAGGDATLDYQADSTIDDVLFADFVYSGQRLDRAVQVRAAAVPAQWHAVLTSSGQDTSLGYGASSRLESLNAAFFDRDPAIVLRGALRKLPTALDLLVDPQASHLNVTAEQAIGSAAVSVSKNLGSFAPLEGDHATVVTDGEQVGASAHVSGMRLVDAYYDGHTRLNTTFDPGGQSFVGAADIDGVHKARLEISNLPRTASIDADTAARRIAYRASEVIDRAHVAYTNTQNGPTVSGTVLEVPSTVDLTYEVGEQSSLHYEASSRIPRIELFGSLTHIEDLRPQQDHYLSAATAGVPTRMDLLVDQAAKHLQGDLEQSMDSIDVVARVPAAGRDWTAMANLAGIPARFDADWPAGTYRFRGLSGPLESARLAVHNHAGAVAPDGLHLAAHYRESTGDVDGSISARDVSHVEYSRTEGNQTFRLDTDTGGDPVFVDADVVLAAGGADDTVFTALGRVDNLPSTVRVDYGEGKLSYGADRNVGLALGVRFGKLAALDGLGAPLFDNGVAAVARGCDDGAGCVRDESAFCQTFPRCFGVVGTVNLPGLPTGLTVDLTERQVVLDDYRPTAALQAYIGVHGLIEGVPDFKAMATLDGLSSPMDLTVGPITVTGGTVDVGYTASAPLGTLSVEADARTTDQRFPVLRGKATVDQLPATMHLTGRLGGTTSVSMRNSAPVDDIAITVTGDRSGYLRAGVSGVPAEADVLVDAVAGHAEVTMSAPIRAVTALVRDIPANGRTWSAFGELRDIPSTFTADWSGGRYLLDVESGRLGSASFAVTNHDGAVAPVGSHLAVHYRETTGNVDASARIANVSRAEYSHTGSDFTTRFNAASQELALDGDVVLAAGGADDVRLAALGTLGPLPNELTISSNQGVVTYAADRTLDIEAQLWVGKVAALRDLGTPRFENGISVVDRACRAGAGCVVDEGPFCLDGECFGATSIINVTGLPASITIDAANSRFAFSDYRPSVDLLELYVADSVFTPAPLTGARAKVELTGLPQGIDFTLGPITLDDGVDIAYDASVERVGSIEVHAEAYDVPEFGTARALAQLDPIPGKVRITGKFGQASDISVENSTSVQNLLLKASGTFEGTSATGVVQFQDVPSKFGITTDVTGAGLTVPNFAYRSPASTLDGLFGLEGRLVRETGPVEAGISGVSLNFTDLGGETDVRLNQDSSVTLTSSPKTSLLEFHTGLLVGPMDRAEVNEELFSYAGGFFTGHLRGHYGLGESSIDDIGFAIHDVGDLTVRPGKIPFGSGDVPPAAGYLMPAFDEGDYDRVELGTSGVDLRPDVDLTFTIERPTPFPDAFEESVVLAPTDTIQFHRYDQEYRPVSSKLQLFVGPADLGCLELSSRPGKVATGANGIVVRGADGQQMVNFLDPGDAIPDYAIDLLAKFLSPFADATLDVSDWNLGSC